MPKIPNMLVVSTRSDVSLDLFCEAAASSLVAPDIKTYEEIFTSGTDGLAHTYDFIYFRDPFNDRSRDYERIQQAVKLIADTFDSAYFVDAVTALEDLLFEDKWAQYQRFPSYMPKTELLRSLDSPKDSSYVIKKRITSRSRGMIFAGSDFPEHARPSDYIRQELLNIETEFRVYMVGADIIKPIALKRSKVLGQKVKVIGVQAEVPSQIISICDAIYSQTKYDLMGLDIAKVGDDYYLLEVNRSCQFKGYERESSINLAKKLNQYLMKVDSDIVPR